MKRSKVEAIKTAFQRGLLMERMGYSVEAGKRLANLKGTHAHTRDPEKKEQLHHEVVQLESTPTLISCAEALGTSDAMAWYAWWFYQAVQTDPGKWLRHALRHGVGETAREFRKAGEYPTKHWKTSLTLDELTRRLDKLEIEESYDVYFIGGSGLVKIGCAKSAHKRLKGLQKCSPVPLILLGYVKGGGRSLEHKYHEEFHYLRHHGEWFVNAKGLKTLLSGLNPKQKPR